VLTTRGQLQETATAFVFEHVQRSAGSLFDLANLLIPFKAFGFFGRVPFPSNMIKRDYHPMHQKRLISFTHQY
jgi:hypothetical protein